ncbi:MAG: ATP-binding protein [Scytonema sp. PMC 1069.18]|nr:ATP-binding protein [Scytonema sp. PMC 1069.18]MEC4881428.1 ATP-binding protein [Scytonema sp. PMC 1070.18]
MFIRSRRNLAYLFTLSMGSIFIVFAGVAYALVVQQQLQAFDERLYRACKMIVGNSQPRPYNKRSPLERKDSSIFSDSLPTMNTDFVYVRLYDPNKLLVSYIGTPGTSILKNNLGFQTLKIKGYQEKEDSNQEWIRELTIQVLQNNLVVGYLQIAVSLTSLRETLNRARLFLTLGVPVTLGLIGITGWFLGGLAMQPAIQSYRQLQRFTADASHELRAPVAAILSNSQVALMPPYDEEEQRFRLENIVEIAKSMSNLLNNLLFLARRDGPFDPATLKTIDLVKLLQPLSEEYQRQAATQNLNFHFHFTEQAVQLKADADLLKQAVVNLLNNAFKYTSEGGTVSLRLLTQSHRAIIQVEDNGIGIAKEHLPHIFERFYRVDTVRSRQTGGFGLGLAIVQQIVQAHRGNITAKSLPDQGSTFQIELPLRMNG